MTLTTLRALCDAATPPPWPRTFSNVDEPCSASAAGGPVISLEDCDAEYEQAQIDQDFICAARTALPLLLDVAEAAKDMCRWYEPDQRGPSGDALTEMLKALAALEAAL